MMAKVDGAGANGNRADGGGNETAPDAEEVRRRRRGKNIALAVALIAWAALVWVITMVNFNGGA